MAIFNSYIPIGSMEYLPTFARTKSPSYVGKYTSTMDPMGLVYQRHLPVGLSWPVHGLLIRPRPTHPTDGPHGRIGSLASFSSQIVQWGYSI